MRMNSMHDNATQYSGAAGYDTSMGDVEILEDTRGGLQSGVHDLESLKELNECPTPPATAPIIHSGSRSITLTIQEKY